MSRLTSTQRKQTMSVFVQLQHHAEIHCQHLFLPNKDEHGGAAKILSKKSNELIIKTTKIRSADDNDRF